MIKIPRKFRLQRLRPRDVRRAYVVGPRDCDKINNIRSTDWCAGYLQCCRAAGGLRYLRVRAPPSDMSLARSGTRLQ